jgi:hypothetical protein|nr:MAG TPA_asm: hypothetical protein [Caudoviricetes sp.]
MENHQAICNGLREALRRTRQYNDLLDLIYVQEPKGRSYVLAVFAGGRKRINTTGSSGWGMIIDIIKQLPGDNF